MEQRAVCVCAAVEDCHLNIEVTAMTNHQHEMQVWQGLQSEQQRDLGQAFAFAPVCVRLC